MKNQICPGLSPSHCPCPHSRFTTDLVYYQFTVLYRSISVHHRPGLLPFHGSLPSWLSTNNGSLPLRPVTACNSHSRLHASSGAVNVIQCSPAHVHPCPRRRLAPSRRSVGSPRVLRGPPTSRTPPGHPPDTSDAFLEKYHPVPTDRPGLFGPDRLSSPPPDTLRQFGHDPDAARTHRTPSGGCP